MTAGLAAAPDRIVRTLDGMADGSRIYTVRADSPAGAILGTFREGRGFAPAALQPRLAPVIEPPGGSRRSRWIAVRRGIARQLKRAEDEWTRKESRE